MIKLYRVFRGVCHNFAMNKRIEILKIEYYESKKCKKMVFLITDLFVG